MTKKKEITVDNDKIVKDMKKRQILVTLIIVFGLATVVLSILSLIFNITFIPAVISFIIEAILSKFLNKERDKVKAVKTDSKNQE